MTIRRLTKEQNRTYRRQFLGDVAYIMFHDALKQWHADGRTSLTDIEITLAACDFCHEVLSLPDAEEGLPCEMDYLEEDAECPTDAMLIMLVATAMLKAWGTHHGDIDTQSLILTIFGRWTDKAEALELLSEASHKEESRWQQGKRNQLMEYELQELEKVGGCEGIDSLLSDLLAPTFSKSVGTIKETLLVLGKYNIEHGHVLDKPLLKVYAQLGGATQMEVGGDNHGIMVNGNLETNIPFTYEQIASLLQAQKQKLITNN